MVVARIERQREAESLSYRALCAREGIAYASLMRWKCRLADGTALIGQPGPPKVESLDLAALRERIAKLYRDWHGVSVAPGHRQVTLTPEPRSSFASASVKEST